jgi:hypothetical protein
MNRDQPYSPPKSDRILRRNTVVARVIGLSLLVFSLLPFAGTIFLLNQELQIVPLEWTHSGYNGPMNEASVAQITLVAFLFFDHPYD